MILQQGCKRVWSLHLRIKQAEGWLPVLSAAGRKWRWERASKWVSIKNREIIAPKFNWNCTNRQEVSSSEFMHRLCGCPMYYILNMCSSMTLSALYFGPCCELSCWLLMLYILISVIHPCALCLIALHHSQWRAVCRQRWARTLSMTWFLLGSNSLRVISVTLPLPLPCSKPWSKLRPAIGYVQSLVMWVSNTGCAGQSRTPEVISILLLIGIHVAPCEGWSHALTQEDCISISHWHPHCSGKKKPLMQPGVPACIPHLTSSHFAGLCVCLFFSKQRP